MPNNESHDVHRTYESKSSTSMTEPTQHSVFTFTFIRHLGKTHNHRSRGDTPWRAQSVSS